MVFSQGGSSRGELGASGQHEARALPAVRPRSASASPAAAPGRDGEVQFMSQRRNSHPGAGRLHKGDRKRVAKQEREASLELAL